MGNVDDSSPRASAANLPTLRDVVRAGERLSPEQRQDAARGALGTIDRLLEQHAERAERERRATVQGPPVWPPQSPVPELTPEQRQRAPAVQAAFREVRRRLLERRRPAPARVVVRARPRARALQPRRAPRARAKARRAIRRSTVARAGSGADGPSPESDGDTSRSSDRRGR